MTYCTNCECTEPRTREMTEEEAKETGIPLYVQNMLPQLPLICIECGSLEDTLIGVNEDAGLDR